MQIKTIKRISANPQRRKESKQKEIFKFFVLNRSRFDFQHIKLMLCENEHDCRKRAGGIGKREAKTYFRRFGGYFGAVRNYNKFSGIIGKRIDIFLFEEYGNVQV